MANIALIGGKSTHFLDDFILEKNIFDYLNLSKPKILFIGYAANDLELAYQKFLRLTAAKYETKLLDDLTYQNTNDLFNWAVCIYFCGGDTKKLVAEVKNSILLEMIRNYLNSNKLFMGISAGAILFCLAGMGDKMAYNNAYHTYNYQMVEGLNILQMTICPHYDHDNRECYNDEVKKYPCNSYALEDDTAILVNDGIKVFKRDKTKSVYEFVFQNDYLMKAIY